MPPHGLERNSRTILQWLYEDIERFSARKTDGADVFYAIPSATCFEILHGLTHLCVAARGDGQGQLEKAERHFFRAALDYSKYHLFS